MEKEIRKLGKDFAEAELRPAWEKLDAGNPLLLESVLSKAAASGMFAFTVPEKHGGAGLGISEFAVMLEEISRASPAAAALLAMHCHALVPMLLNGDVTGAKTVLPKISVAEKSGKPALCVPAVREPGMQEMFPGESATSCAKDKGRFVIFGKKSSVPCADEAAYFTVLGRCEDTGRFAVVSVPAGTAGVTVGAPVERMGLRFCPEHEVEFDNVVVGPECMVAEGVDEKFLRDWYAYADAALAAVAVGAACEARDLAVAYAMERYQGGKMICEHDAVRLMLAGMELRIRAAKSMARGGEGGMLASAFAAEAAEQCCLDAVQMLGGYGYMKDYKIERYLRDVKALRAVVNPRARLLEHAAAEFEKMK